MKTIILFSAVVFTGLSAGLFYAWTVSVIPGTKKISDINYLETMQSINKEILNPAFFLIFFGPLILLFISSFSEYYNDKMIFGFVLAALITYLTGTFGVTVFGNVPLNNQLEKLELVELGRNKLSKFRNIYELKWNKYHYYRTAFSVLSFILILIAVSLKHK